MHSFPAGNRSHTIAYATRGFLECGVLLQGGRYVEAAIKVARAMANVQRSDGWLAATYDARWNPRAKYCCLTGVAQMSVNWIRCAQVAGAFELRTHAGKALSFVKRSQRLDDRDEVARGAIAGSAPIWGSYSRFEFPNWAAKFFADALMMDRDNIAVPPLPELSASRREHATHV